MAYAVKLMYATIGMHNLFGDFMNPAHIHIITSGQTVYIGRHSSAEFDDLHAFDRVTFKNVLQIVPTQQGLRFMSPFFGVCNDDDSGATASFPAQSIILSQPKTDIVEAYKAAISSIALPKTSILTNGL